MGGKSSGGGGGNYTQPRQAVDIGASDFQAPAPIWGGGNSTTQIYSPGYYGEPNYGFNQGGGGGKAGKYGGGPSNIYSGYQPLSGSVSPLVAMTAATKDEEGNAINGQVIPSNQYPQMPYTSGGGSGGGNGKTSFTQDVKPYTPFGAQGSPFGAQGDFRINNQYTPFGAQGSPFGAQNGGF